MSVGNMSFTLLNMTASVSDIDSGSLAFLTTSCKVRRLTNSPGSIPSPSRAVLFSAKNCSNTFFAVHDQLQLGLLRLVIYPYVLLKIWLYDSMFWLACQLYDSHGDSFVSPSFPRRGARGRFCVKLNLETIVPRTPS